MPPYNVLLKPSVEKDLRKLTASIVRHVFEAIERSRKNLPSHRTASFPEQNALGAVELAIIASFINLTFPIGLQNDYTFDRDELHER
jgi:hypothetical protein